MSDFIEKVRRKQVVAPTRKGFDPALWEEVASDEAGPDRDRRFARAGLFFYNHLENIRSRLPDVFDAFTQKPGESVRLIVGFQNRRFRTMQNFIDDMAKRQGEPAFLETKMSVEAPDDIFGSIRVDDSLPTDAVSLIVRHLDPKGETRQGGPAILDSEVETRVTELFRIGSIYDHLEWFWSEEVASQGRI